MLAQHQVMKGLYCTIVFYAPHITISLHFLPSPHSIIFPSLPPTNTFPPRTTFYPMITHPHPITHLQPRHEPPDHLSLPIPTPTSSISPNQQAYMWSPPIALSLGSHISPSASWAYPQQHPAHSQPPYTHQSMLPEQSISRLYPGLAITCPAPS